MTEDKSELLKKAVGTFGTTDKCSASGFILPDGKMLDMTGDIISDVRVEHDVIASLYPEGTRMVSRKFVNDTGAIRMHSMPNTTFLELDSKHDLTPEQVDTIRKCACREGLDPHRIVYDILAGDELIDSGESYGRFRDIPCNSVVNKFVNTFNIVKEGD